MKYRKFLGFMMALALIGSMFTGMNTTAFAQSFSSGTTITCVYDDGYYVGETKLAKGDLLKAGSVFEFDSGNPFEITLDSDEVEEYADYTLAHDVIVTSVSGVSIDLATAYKMTLSTCTNGSIAGFSDFYNVDGINYVTAYSIIKLTPDTGYEVDTVTVKDSSDNDVPFYDPEACEEDGETFMTCVITKPTSDITVSATFKEVTSTVSVDTPANGNVTVSPSNANTGDTVTLTVTPDEGYELDTLEVKNGTTAIAATAGAAANTYTFTLPAGAITVNATFKPVANLDLDEADAAYPISKSVDQNYNLTVAASTYADKTKVKLEWTTTDINASRTDNKVWNPDTLTWDSTTDSNEVTLSQNGGATFTLTNLSSTEVKATASFAQENGFSAPTVAYTEDSASGDGEVTLGTVVQADKSVNTSADHDAVIGVTITPQAADFKALAATSSATKYGTYTVTLSSIESGAATVAVVSGEASIITITSNNMTINAGDTWSDVIANNSGKTLTWSYKGTEHVCTLGTETGQWYDLEDGVTEERVVLMEDGEYQGSLFISSQDDLVMFKPSDTVPENVYFAYVK